MRVAIAQFEGPSTMRVLPLAAGLLAATLRRAPELAGLADSGDLAIEVHATRGPPDAVAAALAGADVLGLSLYTWNEQYTLEVARRVRAASPATLIVAGGPSAPRRAAAAAAFLATHPAIDALVAGEGERPFLAIVRARRASASLRSVATIPGVATRVPISDPDPAAIGAAPDAPILQAPRGPRLTTEDFADIGSPYLDGTFDALLATPAFHGQITAAVFETNRGCPFACTFCDWGQATESKVLELPLARVLAELRWAAERQIPYVYFVDANFGIRRRDLALVHALGDLRAETGYPHFVYFHLTKNATDKNLATVEALRDAGIGTQVSLSMQDFDPAVLAAIRRDNIHPERALGLRAHCHAAGLPTTNELMLGLPAQTATSFRTSLAHAFTPYPGDSFFLYTTRVLVNAELADPAYAARFGLVTRHVPSLPRDPAAPIHVTEREDIIVGSDAMPTAAWADAFAFGYLLSALVNQRLLAMTLRLVRFTLGADLVALVDLVDALLAAPTPRLGAVRAELQRFADATLAEVATLLPIAGLGGTRREPVEGACAAALEDWPAFLAEVEAVLTQALPAHADLVREALACDALQVPAWQGPVIQRHTFTRDWSRWAPHEGRVPAPRAITFASTAPDWARADRTTWFDTFIAHGWSKAPRTSLTIVP